MAVAGVGCLEGQSPLRGSSVSFCKVSGHGKACPLVTRAWLCGCGSVMQNSPSGCHGGCLSVLLTTASSWPVSAWHALLLPAVDTAAGGSGRRVGSCLGPKLVPAPGPEAVGCDGLPWPCQRGLREYFSERIPPCRTVSLCRAPAFAQSGQLGFLCALAVKLASILLKQKEEKGKKSASL